MWHFTSPFPSQLAHSLTLFPESRPIAICGAWKSFSIFYESWTGRRKEGPREERETKGREAPKEGQEGGKSRVSYPHRRGPQISSGGDDRGRGCDDIECITREGERESGNYFFGEEAHSAASQEASGIPLREHG